MLSNYLGMTRRVLLRLKSVQLIANQIWEFWLFMYVITVKFWQFLENPENSRKLVFFGISTLKMFLFPRIAENSQNQKGNHFILKNSQEFLARFYSNVIPRILRNLGGWCKSMRKNFPGMILGNSREIQGFSWDSSNLVQFVFMK